MKIYIFAFIAFTFLMTSCEKAFIPKGVDGESKEAVFEEFWDVFNEKYAMFESKGVDWDSSYTVNKALISEQMSNEALFEIIGNMVLSLRDGHTDLTDFDRDSIKGFDILKGAPINIDPTMLVAHLDTIKTDRLLPFMQQNSFYGILEGNIGYIHISSFNTELSDDTINVVLAHLKDTKGLIIDVRNNTGGDPSGASRLARHLTDKEVATGFERFKTGPGASEFSDNDAFNKPTSGETYTKPIMVLTNGLCFSATTTFIYQTNPLEHFTYIGSRTGGGSGSVADGFLANGWKYSLSTSEFIDYEGRHLDDGFEPDIEAWIDTTNMMIDEVLQRAIDELN